MQIKKVYMTKKRKFKVMRVKALTLSVSVIACMAIIGINAKMTDKALSTYPTSTFAQTLHYEASEGSQEALNWEGAVIRGVTAYNAGDPKQTDDFPCIDASLDNICEALERGEKRCAANFVKLGTVLQIQNYGDCVVTDRMNKRFQHQVDIAMKLNEKQRALNFGSQSLLVKIK